MRARILDDFENGHAGPLQYLLAAANYRSTTTLPLLSGALRPFCSFLELYVLSVGGF
jgi:hypothetical protein